MIQPNDSVNNSQINLRERKETNIYSAAIFYLKAFSFQQKLRCGKKVEKCGPYTGKMSSNRNSLQKGRLPSNRNACKRADYQATEIACERAGCQATETTWERAGYLELTTETTKHQRKYVLKIKIV